MSLKSRLENGNLKKATENVNLKKATENGNLKKVTEKKTIKKTIKKIEDPYFEIKKKIQNEVIDELDIDFSELSSDLEKHIGTIKKLVEENIQKESLDILSSDESKVLEEIMDDIVGFGPITSLLKDEEVTEIMVNGANQVYVEKSGKLILSGVSFKDNNHVLHVIKKIVAPIGRRIDESSPMVDARLPDGSRVNAIIPPLSLDGPVITIRKFSEDPFTIEDLKRFGTLTEKMASFLKICIEGRMNVIVSGGTGSGKTTTLNVLSSFIPEDDRIVTIEDAAELKLSQEHVVRLETRAPNIDGKGQITIRDLVKNSLRMRPDRIVVGEVRGGEALDMLQAMNTGHDGSLTTGHANSPRDMLSRLETMVLMSGMNLPIKAIRNQVASAIDLIIQQTRMQDGSRRITNISEIHGLEGEVIIMQEVFSYVQTGIDSNGKVLGGFKFSGIKPKILDELEKKGMDVPSDLFRRR